MTQRKVRRSLLELADQRKKIEKQLRGISRNVVAQCSHTDENGHPMVHFAGESPVAECELCGTKFNVAPKTEDEVKKAVGVLSDMIHQIKIYSSNTSEEDLQTSSAAGLLDFEIQDISQMYRRVIDRVSKGRHFGNNRGNNRHQQSDYQSVGYYNDDLAFARQNRRASGDNRGGGNRGGYQGNNGGGRAWR